MRPPSLVRRSDGRTVPRPSPGPKQERPDAGRSPGSRVVARHTAFPDRGRCGVDPVAASPKGKCDVRLARRLQLQGQPRSGGGCPPLPCSLLSPSRGTSAIGVRLEVSPVGQEARTVCPVDPQLCVTSAVAAALRNAGAATRPLHLHARGPIHQKRTVRYPPNLSHSPVALAGRTSNVSDWQESGR
jgi:hypothetical protein